MIQTFADPLPKGTTLHHGQYRIEKLLGRGGFGLIYLATDPKLARLVALKEFFPRNLAVRKENSAVGPEESDRQNEYDDLLEKFLAEARTLAGFRHSNIVQVHQFFEDNDTAYMVMSFEKGNSFKHLLEQRRTARKKWTEQELSTLTLPILDGLKKLHVSGFIHRDIKPGNIYIRDDGSPVLLDFGATRQAIGDHSAEITILMTPGYTPPEQHTNRSRHQGEWTDIYAMGAVLFRAITGKAPIDASIRSNARIQEEPDPYRPLATRKTTGYSRHFLEAIDHALQIRGKDRPQTVDAWIRELKGEKTAPPKKNKTPPKTDAPPPVPEDDEPPTVEAVPTQTNKNPKPETWTEPTTGIEFVKITGGCFQMGSNKGDADEKPVHEECVDDFWLAKFTVTNAQYRRFKPKHDSGVYRGHTLNGDQQPVVKVSWAEAVAYAEWLSGIGKGAFRLPTEAEWEYAARAGTRTERFWGDGEKEACQYANVLTPAAKEAFDLSWDAFPCDNEYLVSASVGKFRANPFGLHDMLGNVWEWTCSEYTNSYDDKEKKRANSSSGGSARVFRGGGWYDHPAHVRSAYRGGNLPGLRGGGLGFRLLRTYP